MTALASASPTWFIAVVAVVVVLGLLWSKFGGGPGGGRRGGTM